MAGFDIAGAEAGYPPTRYLDAFDYLKRNNAFFTIHAGEAFGLPSIREAVQICGATGSATACGSSTTSPWVRTAKPRLGDLASYIRDQRIPAGDVPLLQRAHRRSFSIAEHPIGLLRQLASG